MMLDMSPAIVFFAKPMVLKMKQASSYVDGRFVDASTTDVPIKAVIQPATARDLLILPEAERRKQVVTIYTSTPVRVSGDTANTQSDLIQDGANTYKVIHVFDRSDNKFYKALAEFLP